MEDMFVEDIIEDVIYSFISIDSKMYDCIYEQLIPFEKMKDMTLYNKALQHLKLLRTKEQRILDNIMGHISSEEIMDELVETLDSFDFSDEKKQAIAERMRSKFVYNDVRYDCENPADEDFYEEDEEIFDFSREFMIEIENFSHITTDYLYNSREDFKSGELIRVKYDKFFKVYQLDDDLLFSGFNLDNLILLDKDDIARYNGMNKVEYDKAYKNTLRFVFQNSFNNMLKITHKDKEDAIIHEFMYMVKKVDTEFLIITQQLHKNTVQYCNEDNKYLLQDILDILDEELELREDKDNYNITVIEGYDTDIVLPKIEIDCIMDLLKTENEIYELFKKLYHYKLVNDEVVFNQILTVLKQEIIKEKECLLLLPSEYDSLIFSTLVMDMLESYLDIESSMHEEEIDKDKISMIASRLYSAIPDWWENAHPSYKNKRVPYTLEQLFQKQNMAEFSKTVDNNAKRKVQYDLIFSNVALCDVFINNKGNMSYYDRQTDEEIASELEVDLDEYLFDKEDYCYLKFLENTEFLEEIDLDLFDIEELILLDYELIGLQSIIKHLNSDSILDITARLSDEEVIELTQDEIAAITKILTKRQ